MTGLWLEDGELRVRHDLDVPELRPGEALVRVDLAGICGTDHELLAGYADFRGVPGHELVGTVTAGHDPPLGRRVVADINIGCGGCSTCRDLGPGHCRRRRVVGIREHQGAFAGFVALPAANLHAVPDGVPDEAAVFAEPLAAALRVEEQLAPLAPRSVLVIGDGRLGQLVARVLGRTSAAVHVVGRHPRKLRLLEARGVEPLEDGAVPEARFEAVVECSGDPTGLETALRTVRPRGTVVLKSTCADAPTPVDLGRIVVDEIRVLGSRCGRIERAVTLLAGEDLGLAELIDGRYPLSRGPEAFAHSRRPDALKVLLAP